MGCFQSVCGFINLDVTGNKEVRVMLCDISDLQSVSCFAKEFLKAEPLLHILVNNAGKFDD